MRSPLSAGVSRMTEKMDRLAFTTPENWSGSPYELQLELGPGGDDQRLRAAMDALWSHPTLSGPWSAWSTFGAAPESPAAGDLVRPLYGCARLDPEKLGCVSSVVREETGSDWLCLNVPTGMLERVFEVRYPVEPETNRWTRRLDRFLADLGARVYAAVPFRLGLVGEEVSGVLYGETIVPEDCQHRVLLLPDALWQKLALRLPYERLAPGLIAVGLGGSG